MLKNFEQLEINQENLEEYNHVYEVNKQFKSKVEAKNGVFSNISSNFDNQIYSWLEIGKSDIEKFNRVFAYERIKDMFKGVELPNGERGLGLEEISKRKINQNYVYSNTKQQAGWAAEVISTAKENINANIKGSGIETYRTDDIAKLKPELGYKINDEYVDKVRVDSKGNVIELIKCNFEGIDSQECFDRFDSKDYDECLNSGKVDKIEILKDYYDEIKNKLLPEKIKSLKMQIEHLIKESKDDEFEIINKELEKYKKIDDMIEKSMVSVKESVWALKYPKLYKTFIFGKNGIDAVLRSGLGEVGVTCAISTVENYKKVVNKEMDVQDAILDTLAKIGKSVNTTFEGENTIDFIPNKLQNLGRIAIKDIGSSYISQDIMSVAVDSFDAIVDFTNNSINSFDYADKIDRNLNKIWREVGSQAGNKLGKKIGGFVGSLTPAGSTGGAAIGECVGNYLGGIVGPVVLSCAYSEVSKIVKGNSNINLKELEKKAKTMSNDVISLVEQNTPELVDSVKVAFNDFGNKINLPFTLC